MLDFCLEPGKIKALKMLDLQTKSTINQNNLQVQHQATSQAFSDIHSILGTNGRYFKSLLGINPYIFGILTYTNEPFPL